MNLRLIDLAHALAQGALVTGCAGRRIFLERGGVLDERELGRAQHARPAEPTGLHMQPGAELEGLEAVKGMQQRMAAADRAVVLEQHRVVPIGEGGRDVLAEQLAARNGIGGKPHAAADLAGLGND